MAYLYSTRGVLDVVGDSGVISDELVLEEITLGNDVFTPLGPARFTLTLSNTGGGIVGSGRASARFSMRCVRCLCDYEAEVVADVEGFYVEPGDDADLPEEQEREYITDDKIDLEPAVAQSLVLGLPFAPVHAADCAGICPSCGADLNEGPCSCGADLSASPFAALKDLLEPGGGASSEDV